MKSATRRTKSTTATMPSGFPDDQGDAFGAGLWPTVDEFGASINDPWTASTAVAQAWPDTTPSLLVQQHQQQKKEKNKKLEELWTSTDESGFPSDPFVPKCKWPSPTHQRQVATPPAKQRQPPQQQEFPQRMSDEDWLPTLPPTNGRRSAVPDEQASTWGSVVQGRSDESDDWHTDPLSFSQDGGAPPPPPSSSAAETDPPLGTEARPIEVEDYALEDREAEMLQRAQQKRHGSDHYSPPALINDPAAAAKPSQRPTVQSNHQSVAVQQPQQQPQQDDFSPRKGIMRLFGSGRKKKKGGSDAGSSVSETPRSNGRSSKKSSSRKDLAAGASAKQKSRSGAKATESPRIETKPSADQSIISGVTNPTFVAQDPELESSARLMREQRDRILAKQRVVGPSSQAAAAAVPPAQTSTKMDTTHDRKATLAANSNLTAKESIDTADSSVVPPVTSKSDFGDPFFENPLPPEDIDEYANDDPALDHLIDDDNSSTDNQLPGDENLEEEKKEDEDFLPVREQRGLVVDHYQPKYVHEYDLDVPPPPPPPPTSSLPPPPPPPPPPPRKASSPHRSKSSKKDKQQSPMRSSHAQSKKSPKREPQDTAQSAKDLSPPRTPPHPKPENQRAEVLLQPQGYKESTQSWHNEQETVFSSPPQKPKWERPQRPKLSSDPIQRHSSQRNSSPQPSTRQDLQTQEEPKVNHTGKTRSMFERRGKLANRTPPRSVQPGHASSLNATSTSLSPALEESKQTESPASKRPTPSTKHQQHANPAVSPQRNKTVGKNEASPRRNLTTPHRESGNRQNAPSPGRNTTPLQNKRRTNHWRSPSPCRDPSPASARSTSPVPAPPFMSHKLGSAPASTAEKDMPGLSLSENSSGDTSMVTPGMAARLRDRQRKKSTTKSDANNNPQSLQKPNKALRDRTAKTMQPSNTLNEPREVSARKGVISDRLRTQPKWAESRLKEENKSIKGLTTSRDATLTPFDRRQARLAQQLAPEPRYSQARKATEDRPVVQPNPKYEGIGRVDSLTSVGKDIGHLRHIRRTKTARSINNEIVPYSSSGEYSASAYDENDPMQRASLRLLSKQVIPIQSLFRRYLALGEALTRMWAVMIIQATARRFLVQNWLDQQHGAACLIQAVYRGGRVRDQVLLEHCCAVEIQRCVRGYLATLAVYAEIYQITLVQSVIRRKQAIDKATDRMVFIIQLQSLSRGFLCRKRMKHFDSKAVTIQKKWRGSYQRLCFELALLDVVIVQSMIRKKLATKRVNQLRSVRNRNAATRIQTFWRSRSRRLSYQMDLFDIVLVQSIVRRTFATKKVSYLRRTKQEQAATRIQTMWRCLSQRWMYQMDLFDVIVSQNAVRRKFAIRQVSKMREERRKLAATKIQTMWRCITQRLLYQMDLFDIVVLQNLVRRKFATRRVSFMKMERDRMAATKIQTMWRSLSQRWIYQMDLFDIIVVQNLVRRRSAIRDVSLLRDERNRLAATKIQTMWRCRSQRLVYQMDLADIMIIQSIVRRNFAFEYVSKLRAARHRWAATTIQTAWRCLSQRLMYQMDLFDILIVQSAVRRKFATKYVSQMREQRHRWAATKIQTVWRCLCQRLLYQMDLVDIVLAQSAVRRWFAFEKAAMLRREREECAATKIQTMWRCVCQRLVFQMDLCDIVVVQAVTRRMIACRETNELRRQQREAAATKIQTFWRCVIQRLMYRMELYDIITTQNAARRMLAKRRTDKLRNAKREVAAVAIQSYWRSVLYRWSFQLDLLNVVLIQSATRRMLAKKRISELNYAKESKAVTVIQTAWRSASLRLVYQLQLMDIVLAQNQVRAWLARKETNARRVVRDDFAATKIQALWRCYDFSVIYRQYCAARKIQKIWRGYDLSNIYSKYMAARKIQTSWRRYSATWNHKLSIFSVTLIQATFRMHTAQRMFRNINAIRRRRAAVKIEKTWRGYTCFMAYQIILFSAITIQSLWRGRTSRKYFGLLLESRSHVAATMIQSIWRCTSIRSGYIQLQAAIILQTHWRRHTCQASYRTTRAVTKIQANCRRHLAENRFKEYLAATKIQAVWRSYDCTMNYLHFLTDVLTVQSAVRSWIARKERAAEAERTALVIQRAVRMHLAQMFVCRIFAARMIQGCWRHYTGWTHLRRLRAAASIRSAWKGSKRREVYLAEHSAVQIQRMWRGFVAYADFMFCIADIVVAQSLVRRYLALKNRQVLKEQRETRSAITIQAVARTRYTKKTLAATTIQSHWRSFLAETEYFIDRFENRAATIIQRAWRRLVCFSNFSLAIESVIRIQATYRGYRAFVAYEEQIGAALVIQAAYSNRLSSLRETNRAALGYIMSTSDSLSQMEHFAASRIQKVIRGNNVRVAVRYFVMARTIQTAWRAFRPRSDYKYYFAARRIQTGFRGWRVRKAYRFFIAARKIQAVVRGKTIHKAYVLYMAARKIQSVARGRRVQSAYKLFIAARRIQAIWRGYRLSHAYKMYLAARTIQCKWRCYAAASSLKKRLAAKRIQSMWRCKEASSAYTMYTAARKIQSRWRCKEASSAFNMYLAARKIQMAWRCKLARSALKRRRAAVQIQAAWRGKEAFTAYTMYMAARRIQSMWRFKEAFMAYKMYLAATRIQSLWKAKCTRFAYKVYRSARLIQTIWRGTTVCLAYKQYQAAVRIQNHWRSVQAKEEARNMRQKLREYCAAILIQSTIRRKLARVWFVAYREIAMADEITAAIMVQKTFRGASVRTEHCFLHWKEISRRREIAVITIQRYWRGYSASEKYWQILGSAILIQSFARMWDQVDKYNALYGATILVQSFARVMLAKQELERRKFIISFVKTMQGTQTNTGSKSPVRNNAARTADLSKTSVTKRPKESSTTIRTKQQSLPRASEKGKDWKNVLEEQQRLDRAARVIQSFFSMVKREVDLAIQKAEKKRRKKKKSRKQRPKQETEQEDIILDDVWDKIGESSKKSTRAEETAPNFKETIESRKPKLPAVYAVPGSVPTGQGEDDARSFISTSSFHKAPQSRMALPKRIIDDDYALETAWMDAHVSERKKQASAKGWLFNLSGLK